MFDGKTFEATEDMSRLKAQLARVSALMRDAEWRTLAEISAVTSDPPASVSARLRDFRKEKFGSHTVERRARGERKSGLFEYRLLVNSQLALAA